MFPSEANFCSDAFLALVFSMLVRWGNLSHLIQLDLAGFFSLFHGSSSEISSSWVFKIHWLVLEPFCRKLRGRWSDTSELPHLDKCFLENLLALYILNIVDLNFSKSSKCLHCLSVITSTSRSSHGICLTSLKHPRSFRFKFGLGMYFLYSQCLRGKASIFYLGDNFLAQSSIIGRGRF